ncbi:hypothetical protein [Micromonospora inaquosa]|uniref:SAM-dependent methyltransferase n=1 Tax=Micromonospora inaquosa TaxID=2203716 RepID=A0A3N9X1Y1_9ACTN|nr:hypothetical protein [Micromonospora inaquosa]RQX07068.1 hypothetical protein DLJ59_03655 [Micromonospora inaquosa]
MPQTNPHLPERPPVGLFLVPAHHRDTPLIDPSAWHGIDPQRLAWLIRHYTRDGDVVADLDNHPTVARAARYLHRHPATITTDGDRIRVADDRTARARCLAEDGVALLLAGLSRPDGHRLGLHDTAEAMHLWHRLLRPGGFVLVALPARAPEPGRISRRSTIISAARIAGLRYHQHIPVIVVPLPVHDPRTDSAAAASTPPALLNGRHLHTHMDVLAFTATTLDQEDTDA